MTQSRSLIAERYRLIESLGAGGMGRVWLARDEMLRRDVAIKEVIPPEGLTPEEREELRLRTLREARAAARLNDANVVRIYDVVQTEHAPWIVMEYVPSRSLHQVITDDGPLPPERAAQIGLAVLNALKAAHAAGVLHRDVKPGNVLLADTGRVVLTDFGLAVFEGGDGAVTRPGLILGSPQYISPERAREGTSGPESDLWSLGATLYAAVEGRSPYARSTTYATLTALATEEPDPPTRAGVLKPVLNALLRKDPRARAGVAETERLLQRAAAGEGRVWSWSLPRPRRSREGHPGGPRVLSGGLSRGASSRGSSQPLGGGSPQQDAPVSSPPAGLEEVSPAPAGAGAQRWNQGPFADAPAQIDFPGQARGSAAVPADPPGGAGLDARTARPDTPGEAAGDDRVGTVPPGQHRGRWIAAVLVALALLAGAIVMIVGSGDDGQQGRQGRQQGGPSGAQATNLPAGPATTGASGPAPSESPQVRGTIGGTVMDLPAGFHWETDATYGWAVAVPNGWVRSVKKPSYPSMISFTDPLDGRWEMAIDTSFNPPKGDPVDDWRGQEQARLRDGLYPAYQQVKIVPIDFRDGWACADWQWRYTATNGRLHISNMGCRVNPGRGHAIYWQTPDALWDDSATVNKFNIVKLSFRVTA
ncbi:protein kinase [Dactylosporangium aurantiacum]|uniref:non-specific serine/threonine protein kinase n=1 Tax=Dactylosporangium aurantiacum TaxID=35754 RepID=A0A9Q9IH69_9ACTN|nr:serine/threonine-protein kinase [Dactylosporangium aurantiacum]MDG6104950.1 protein kinase [Dactylosporangium aurantiacum]UWZ55521.1 protein kinase [Dactylosporangium aurantiacum]